MSRAKGWYWIKRQSDEDWQIAYWGPCAEYPGEWRWRMSHYLEFHRGKVYKVSRRVHPPTESTTSRNVKIKRRFL